ncbi:hypothetical protein CN505_11515 [Bacillus cereus]|nr:hypothetical protein CN509_07450 [Bacillus cereus]PET05872.1 hypothetical protein CN505_11515 [Bacillus cereus]
MEWIIQNKEGLFSGIGVVSITGIIGLVFKNKIPNQSITSGKNSRKYQSGNNLNITIGEKNDGK